MLTEKKYTIETVCRKYCTQTYYEQFIKVHFCKAIMNIKLRNKFVKSLCTREEKNVLF